jgi:predicted dinucleotide-binding enzyme
MKIAILGTGMVGRSIGGKLCHLGHEVTIGTRDVAATLARTESALIGQERTAAETRSALRKSPRFQGNPVWRPRAAGILRLFRPTP